MTDEAAGQIEAIGDTESVSRAYFALPGELAPESHFQFIYDKDRDERAESVYWRRYAPSINDVHERGCSLQAKWIGTGSKQIYEGARTAVVERIRSIRSERGHRFEVIHYPQDSDRAHAHVAIVRASGKVQGLNKNDKLELVRLIAVCFTNFEPHIC